MNDLRKAAEMALEALENIRGSLVIQALRQALAQPDEVLAERERTAVIETIKELRGMESDRHPMFSDGYDYALDHIEQFVRGRGEK
jgi:predicted RNA-binding protein with EMAP domain